MTLLNISIKGLTPDLLDDFLCFFDTIKFCENPYLSSCYCYSFHFTGASHEWNRNANRRAVIEYIKEGRH